MRLPSAVQDGDCGRLAPPREFPVNSGARDSPHLDGCGLPAKTDSIPWKEIAAYLNRSVRTSRRWEAEEDLLELRRQMRSRDSQIALDVTLVDATAVRFLVDRESEGVT